MDNRKEIIKICLRISKSIILIIGFTSSISAQSTLSLQEALRIGLENNFDIRIAKNDAEFAKAANTYGTAGFLPTVSATGSRNFQWNDISQKFASGLEVNRPGVATNSTNLGVAANWVFFDGGKMFITKKKQDAQQSAADIRIQNQILNFSDTLSAAYYQLVLSRLDLEVSRQDVNRTAERLKIASEQFRIGTRPKSDQLIAQIDLNTIRNRIQNQQQQIEIRKGAFNQLLGRDPEVGFEVVDTVGTVKGYDFSQLKAKVLGENLQLKYQRQNLEVTKLGIKEIKSRGLPQVSLNTAYNFGRTRSQAGFALYNQSLGPNIGISAAIPIFTGTSVNRLVKLANLDLETRNLQLKLAESRLLSQLWRALKTLDLHLESAEIEKQNIALATENNQIVQGRFRLGQATSLELKDAEFQLSNAQSRLLQAKFNAKIAENQVLRLSAELKL
ncbi:MAG TPA: TolC family protein [Catalimonadaceae bacterium]|nr:TolC family protein [Catalimonadaceae bacterium]